MCFIGLPEQYLVRLIFAFNQTWAHDRDCLCVVWQIGTLLSKPNQH